MPAGGEEKARAFYGHLLGLTELPKPNSLAARGGAWFQCAAIALHLGVELAEQEPDQRLGAQGERGNLDVLIGGVEVAAARAQPVDGRDAH